MTMHPMTDRCSIASCVSPLDLSVDTLVTQHRSLIGNSLLGISAVWSVSGNFDI